MFNNRKLVPIYPPILNRYTFPTGKVVHPFDAFYGSRVLGLALTSCDVFCKHLIIKK